MRFAFLELYSASLSWIEESKNLWNCLFLISLKKVKIPLEISSMNIFIIHLETYGWSNIELFNFLALWPINYWTKISCRIFSNQKELSFNDFLCIYVFKLDLVRRSLIFQCPSRGVNFKKWVSFDVSYEGVLFTYLARKNSFSKRPKIEISEESSIMRRFRKVSLT